MFRGIILLGLVFFCACATIKNTSEGFGRGVVEDAKNTWKALTNFDRWWKEQTW